MMAGAWTATAGSSLLVGIVLLPFVAMLLGLLLGGRWLYRVALGTLPFGLLLTLAIAERWADGAKTPLLYVLGNWAPPLGIALRADGAAVAMLVAVAGVVFAIGLFARADFAPKPGEAETRSAFSYWLLLLAIWGALNLVFVSGDLFTLYVALELLTFAGVPLVCLAGSGETLRAALRYMLFALFGSVLYLLGAVLLYGGYGTLDIPLLASAVRPDSIARIALALMTAGLLAKTALFPLHLWLPPAHGGAPAAASAVLSALVIKGSWFLVLRLWFDVMPAVVTLPVAQLLAGLGASAIVVGSVVALRQERLKLLVAYSTMAQIGYLFLMFPLAFEDGRLVQGPAMHAGILQAISHATAKAGMFMAAGLVYAGMGHDRIADLAGAARTLPITMLAFAVSGLALMGVVPSGAYLSKKILLEASVHSGQWWWTAVLQGGAVFTAAYLVLVVGSALRQPATPLTGVKPVSKLSQWMALILAVSSLVIAFAANGLGNADLIKNPIAPDELIATLAILLGGTVLAVGLARFSVLSGPSESPLRRLAMVPGVVFERLDAWMRRWTNATLLLIFLAVVIVGLTRVGPAT
jgi:formate hydrogenlyase subunit 3/multisubunit Na+/H+ antiporter MnhD subunit